MAKGAYILITKLKQDGSLRIGSLGKIHFKKGYYCYVGSALGNLEKRIARHKRKNKKLHWHIDYFLKKAKIKGITALQTTKRIECSLSRKLKHIADSRALNFGSSDCKCQTHLYYFKKNPIPKLKWTLKH
jgi:sugar fermentation stimulation protein A